MSTNYKLSEYGFLQEEDQCKCLLWYEWKCIGLRRLKVDSEAKEDLKHFIKKGPWIEIFWVLFPLVVAGVLSVQKHSSMALKKSLI